MIDEGRLREKIRNLSSLYFDDCFLCTKRSENESRFPIER